MSEQSAFSGTSSLLGAAFIAVLANPAILIVGGNGCSRPEPASDVAQPMAQEIGIKGSKPPATIDPAATARVSPPAAQPMPTFGNLSIDTIEHNDGEVLVRGSTDLPDASRISIQMDTTADEFLRLTALATVTGGSYVATLRPPPTPLFNKGRYKFEASYFPGDQQDLVTQVVGPAGQSLHGGATREENGFRYLETKTVIELEMTPTPLPMPNVEAYEEGTPEHAFAHYLLGWKQKNWPQMLRSVQHTWLSTEGDPETSIDAWYGFKVLLGAEILDVRRGSKVLADLEARVFYISGSKFFVKKITARLVKETSPYNPSELGTWGVNPISAMREEDL